MNKSCAAVLCVLLLLISQAMYSQSDVTVYSFDRDTIFNGTQVLHMHKGDESVYKNKDFDDSSWRISAFPFTKKDYDYIGSNEKDIFWYRIHVLFPQDLPSETVGLSLGKFADVDETYLNGNLIGKSGDFQNPLSHAFDKTRIYQIPTKYIIPGEQNVISIRVKNTYRADEMPGRGNFYFGNFEKMKSVFFINGFSELLFPVVYLVFFAYFMLLFSQRTKELENLFFSLFCLGFSLYPFCRSSIKYELINNFLLLQKLEFGGLFFTLPMLMAFILVYFKEKHRLIHFIFYGFSALCIIVLVFLSNHMIWFNLNVNFIQYTWLIPFGTVFWILVKHFKKSIDARIMFFSIIIIFTGILLDILSTRGIQIITFVTLFYTPFTVFLFMVSLAAILSIRFANFMTQIEVLNETLEQKVMDRTARLDKSLQEINLKDEKIEQEMIMAGKVQMALLPAVLPSWDVQVSVRYSPLRQVSGDFYDLIQTPDGGYMLVIADVSGHGMPAALHAILAKKAFFKAAMEEPTLAGVYRVVNKEMGKIDTGHYLTAFMVKFDRKNTLMYANAGHPNAIWLSKKNKKIKLLDTPGTIVGIREDAETLFRDATISFEPGDRVLLYTDCLIERSNLSGEQFGETRLLNTLKKYFYENLEDMINHTMKDFYDFVEGSENKDDLTLVAMEYPDAPTSKKVKVPLGTEKMDRIMDSIDSFDLAEVPAY